MQHTKKLKQFRLRFEADSRHFRRHGKSVADGRAVTESAKGLEAQGVRLGSTEAECGWDVQREKVSAMRPKRRPVPTASSRRPTICSSRQPMTNGWDRRAARRGSASFAAAFRLALES